MCDHPIAEPDMRAQVVVFTCEFAVWLGVADILGRGVETGCNVDWDEEILRTLT